MKNNLKIFRHHIFNERALGGGYKPIPEEPFDPRYILQKALSCDQNDVRQIFMEFGPIFFCYRHPSSSDFSCMQIILKAMHSGMLKHDVEFIDTEPDLNEQLISTGPVHGRTVESAEHKGMKLWIIKHLREKGINAIGEVSHLGYEVDVGSISDKVFIECGDTEPKKVFVFLKNSESVGILQYSSEEIVWFISTPEFVRFAEKEWFKVYGLHNNQNLFPPRR